MAKQLLVDSWGDFILDRGSVVQESTESGKTVKRISGRLSICDTVNGNGRKYPKRVWEKNLAEGSTLRKLIQRNEAWGLLEHPKDGEVDLRSPIAVRLVSVNLQENGELHGEIRVLGTPEGMRLQALIDEGYNPRVSSRGFGSVVKVGGVDEVQDDYVCEGWDIVAKPSFETAETSPIKESTTPPAASTTVTESVLDNANPKTSISEAGSRQSQGERTLSEAQPRTPASSGVRQNQPTSNTMDPNKIREIRERIAALSGTNMASVTPQRFAEGIEAFTDMHRSVSSFVAEDQKRSWDGDQLHKEINEAEEKWKAAFSTKAETNKLQENGQKFLKLATSVASAALGYKKKLAEALEAKLKYGTVIKELARRGRAWRTEALSLKSKNRQLTEQLTLATDGLDLLAERYNGDVTRLGVRLLQLEFREKVGTAEIKKLLDEAKHPDHVVAIREKLSPKTPTTEPAPAKTGEEKPALTEGKTGAPSAASAAEATKPTGTKAPVLETAAPIFTVDGAVGIARRLSESRR